MQLGLLAFRPLHIWQHSAFQRFSILAKILFGIPVFRHHGLHTGHYSPPDVQTPDLHCSTKQYTVKPVFLFITFRGPSETPDHQTTQHSTHYQPARTHIYSHFSHGQLSTGTNVTQTAPETIS